MLESTRIYEQLIEVKSKLRSDRLSFLTGEEEDFSVRQGEIRALRTSEDELEAKYVKALGVEDEEAQVAMAKVSNLPEDRWTPELRELAELGSKISIADYIKAAVEGRAPVGAAGEYNTHVFGRNAAGDMPIEVLMDRDQEFTPDDWKDIKEAEHRTTITGANVNPGASTNFVSQMFATSESAFMGASFPAVGVGDHSYPIFSKVTTAGDFNRDGAESAPSGSITINTATNRRLQASMEIAAEDENRIPNIAGGLTAHLRRQIQSELDEYGIGQLWAGLPNPADTAVVETLANFISRFGSAVDGIRARNIGDVRALVGTKIGTGGVNNTAAFTVISGLSLGAGGSHFAELWDLASTERLRGSAHLPGTGDGTYLADSDGPAIMVGTAQGLQAGRFQVPIWRRAQMLRDTGVGQLSGTIRYTAAMFAAVEITATDQHVPQSIHTE